MKAKRIFMQAVNRITHFRFVAVLVLWNGIRNVTDNIHIVATAFFSRSFLRLFISLALHTDSRPSTENIHNFIMEICLSLRTIHIAIIIILCSYKMLIKMPSETPCILLLLHSNIYSTNVCIVVWVWVAQQSSTPTQHKRIHQNIPACSREITIII